MKYVVILGDGMADYPSKALGGRTPLEVANKPNIDALCKKGKLGLVKTVPDGMKPGSDVANLAMMGYDPQKYYTGRSPLEALSIGIDMKDDDVAIRCNLVTLSDEENFIDKTMIDYSAEEITTEEAKQLISYLQEKMADEYIDFYAGVSYRHCMIAHDAQLGTLFTPPHDITGKKIAEFLPQGEFGDIFLDIMIESNKLLKDHPVNQRRIEKGLRPANSIWLWGEGTRPELPSFEEKYGIKGAVISAVDLLKGIGIGAKMKVIDVEGVTGTYKTNFQGKAEAAIEALKGDCDYVYIHMEAPDECGHQGDAEHKVKSIELIDSIVVKYVKQQLDLMGVDYKILIAPDHPTPLELKTHTADPVPFIIYTHKANSIDKDLNDVAYSEENAAQSGIKFDSGEELMQEFLSGVQEDKQDEIKTDEATPIADAPAEKDTASSQNNTPQSTDVSHSDTSIVVIPDSKDQKDKKESKSNKQGKKLNKTAVIAIIASVCLIGIILAIVLPVVFFHAPRIFVKGANGFVASKVGAIDKYFYVLDNNITCDELTFDDSNIYSIDLNKHTLTVNGKLTVSTSKSGTLYIGTRKGKKFVTNGKSNLKANEIYIDAPNMDVILMADVSCEELTVVGANSLSLYSLEGGASKEIIANIHSGNVSFNGKVSASSTSEINISDCPNVAVNQGVTFEKIKMNLTASVLTAASGSTIATLQLDGQSSAIISGAITDSIDGGKQVIMKEGHSCPTYKNIATLVIFRNNQASHSMTNCNNVIYVEKLAKPIDIIIEERENRIFCKVAKVKYASSYKFVVNDGENDVATLFWEKNTYDDPEFDITQYVSQPGKSYTITVTPQGNYSDDFDFANHGSSTMYVDGEWISVKYDYVITLNMPTGLSVRTSMDGDVKKTFFEFNKVDDADAYKLFIDGKEIKDFKIDTDEGSNKCSIDISQYVDKVGNHSIRVGAINTQNPNIQDSPLSMIAHSSTEKLNAVAKDSLVVTMSEDINTKDDATSVTASIHASWLGVQNGYEYLIELQINGGEKITVGRTSIISNGGNVVFSFNLDETIGIEYDRNIALQGGYVVIVTALEHDYYTCSDATQCVPTLDAISSGDIGSGDSSNAITPPITSGEALFRAIA